MIARAVRGPITLICLGSLFALQQSGIAPFKETWPLLLIVFGLMKLIEWLLLPRYLPAVPPPPPPPGAPPYGGTPR
jgi:hypothetical protein